MRTSARSPGTLLAALYATGACYAYQPTATAPEAGSRVRVVFASATPVTTYPASGEPTPQVYPGVLEATGAILAAASDTVVLRLGELRTASGRLPNLTGHLAALPTARIALFEDRRFQAGRTALTAVGALGLAATTYVILLIVAVVHAAR
jgi:hypothetical protein